MFIEKISDEAKQTYIQNIIDQKNATVKNEDGLLRPVERKTWETEEMKKLGYDQIIVDLKKRNIYFEIYEDHLQRLDERDTFRYAFITAFGDAQVKSSMYLVNKVMPLHKNIADTLRMLDRCEQKVDFTNSLEVDNTYVKEFMLPNLQAIDEKQNTHLVADYKNALNNQFAKKKYLAIQNIQRQQDDLGLEIKGNHAVEHGIY